VKKFLKTVLAFCLQTHKKSVLGSLIAILVGGIVTTMNNVYQSFKNTIQSVNALNKSMIQDDSRLDHLDDEMSQTIKQVDWIAYINRKDGEYHTQQSLNHQLFEDIGKIEGSQLEDEKVLEDLLGHTIERENND
jgi:hypothetical protein